MSILSVDSSKDLLSTELMPDESIGIRIAAVNPSVLQMITEGDVPVISSYWFEIYSRSRYSSSSIMALCICLVRYLT